MRKMVEFNFNKTSVVVLVRIYIEIPKLFLRLSIKIKSYRCVFFNGLAAICVIDIIK